MALTHRKETGKDDLLADIGVEVPDDRHRQQKNHDVRHNVQGGIGGVKLLCTNAVLYGDVKAPVL